jgi:small subunit ribosomal protein S2
MSITEADIKTLFDAGAHIGYTRSRRHPSSTKFLFGTKDHTDIFNLEETAKRLDTAAAYASSLSQAGKVILFVGGKNESSAVVKATAERVGAPFVASRWIGGTLTNFKNIRQRLARLEKLTKERETGELDKYTKRERLMIDREIAELENRFGGIARMTDLPAALFVVDTRYEHTAVTEANQLGIPVIGLSSSDGDFKQIQYPIPANDTSIRSVRLVVETIADAIQAGRKVTPTAA